MILASAPREVSGSPWLVLADRAGVGEALAAALERRGEPVVLASAGETVRPARRSPMVGSSRRCARTSRDSSPRAPAVTAAGAASCTAAALDAPEDGRGADVDAAQRASCGSLLSLTQALVGSGGRGAASRSWW